jgi:hypothetical protein
MPIDDYKEIVGGVVMILSIMRRRGEMLAYPGDTDAI